MKTTEQQAKELATETILNIDQLYNDRAQELEGYLQQCIEVIKDVYYRTTDDKLYKSAKEVLDTLPLDLLNAARKETKQ